MSEPFWLARDESRELDRRAIEEFGVPGVVLMENAGSGVAELLMRLNPDRRRVAILCGPGNNGGDGFVIARHLEIHGWPIRVWLFAPSTDHPGRILRLGIAPKLSPDCDTNFRIFARTEADVTFVDSQYPLNDAQKERLHGELTSSGCWIVDALFGTGLDRPLQLPFADVISIVNTASNPIVAVDIPSGLDCDTGQPLGPTIRAAHTATFVAWKKGFLEPSAMEWTGEVHVVGIGAPKMLVDEYRASRDNSARGQAP